MGTCCAKKQKADHGGRKASIIQDATCLQSRRTSRESNTWTEPNARNPCKANLSSRKVLFSRSFTCSLEQDCDLRVREAISKEDTASKLEEIDQSPFMTPKSDIETLDLIKRPVASKDLLAYARSAPSALAVKPSIIVNESSLVAPCTFPQRPEFYVFLSRSSVSSDGSLQYSLSAYGSNTSRV
mmetsp:Transcript_12436/g.23523  ORF Transcript_12436/g.23523 Transcript_12436/m.23523 type:complete len:184 (-) Transcript_12436:50-601(-)